MTSPSTSPWPQVTVPFADHVGIDYHQQADIVALVNVQWHLRSMLASR